MKPVPEDPVLRGTAAEQARARPPADALPDYLARTYTWAYLNPRNLRLLDRMPVVNAILWGNANRLMQAAVAEFEPGQRVLQAACVYGDFSMRLARRLGDGGRLEVVDVAPVQVENLWRKAAGKCRLEVRVGDLAAEATLAGEPPFDGVCCFFLLHEVPAPERARIVHNLLGALRPGGRIVFVDYHQPASWNPLRPVMAAVFRWLEPYAPSLLRADITALSPLGAGFVWRRRSLFGGLYQIVVGERPG